MKYSIILLFSLLASISMKAQDSIRLREGKTIAAIVHQVEESRIQYHLFTYPDGPLFIKSIHSIEWIKYKNGMIDSFPLMKVAISGPFAQKDTLGTYKNLGFTYDQIDSIAIKDASQYYSALPTGTGVFLTTVFTTPVVGLITAMATSSAEPKKHTLNIPATPIAENPRYIESYKEKAYEIKRQKAGNNFAWGFVVSVAVTFFYLVVSNQ